jgi:hypothetical protein
MKAERGRFVLVRLQAPLQVASLRLPTLGDVGFRCASEQISQRRINSSDGGGAAFRRLLVINRSRARRYSYRFSNRF